MPAELEQRESSFVFNPRWNLFAKSPLGHDDAFKQVFARELRYKFNRELNDEQFGRIWKLAKEGGGSLHDTFRSTFMQGIVYKDRIELFKMGLNPDDLRWLSRILVHHFENRSVVIKGTNMGDIELGGLHGIPDMPLEELQKKLAGIRESSLPELPRETVQDLLLEMGEPRKAPADIRYFLLEVVNSIRHNHGKPPLRLDEAEARNAKTHAEHMLNVGGEVETKAEYLRDWKEVVAHGPIEKSADEEAYKMFLKKALMEKVNLAKILGAKSDVGADIAVRDGKLALSMRVK